MRGNTERVDALIEAIYEAPLVEGAWERFLNLLGSELRSGATALLSYDFRNEASHLNHVVRIGKDTLSAYEQHFANINPWLRAENEGRFVAGRAQFSEEIVPYEEVKKTEFYHEFGRRNQIVHTLGLVMQRPGSKVMPVLSANRGERLGMFRPDNAKLLERLSPHLHRAIDWQSRELRYQSMRDLFVELPDATWELDGQGRVLESNRAAGHLESEGRVIRLRMGKLEFLGRNGFESLSARLSRTWDGTVVADGYLAVRPLRGGWLVVLKRLAVPAARRMESIGGALGLTPAELRLLNALLEGGGLKEAAERLGVSLNTAKTQLAGLFGKTGTRRQADLLRVASGWVQE